MIRNLLTIFIHATKPIQIKTFLQHAWGLATHDLIYKADEINWAKERIAFQIKATLEQAEVTISGVNRLIELAEVSKDSYETIELKNILDFYRTIFQPEDLPRDIIRLCKNTKSLLYSLHLNVEEVKDILINENGIGKGTNLKNLSPYLLVLQSIINQKKDVVERFINSTYSKQNRQKLIIPKELDISTLNIEHEDNLVKSELEFIDKATEPAQ
jgi:hypothetical protein